MIGLFHRNVNRFSLEIGLKSSIISKVDHPMSKNWKKGSIILLETTNKFWGPIVLGDQLSWGPFVHGDQIFGDCLSRGTNCLGDQMSRNCLFLGTNCGGPNVWGLNVFGTKWESAHRIRMHGNRMFAWSATPQSSKSLVPI